MARMSAGRAVPDPAGAVAVEAWTTSAATEPFRYRYFDGPRRTFNGNESGGSHEGEVAIRGMQIENASTERWITLTVRHAPGEVADPDVRIDGIEPGQARELGRLLIETADEAEQDNATDDYR
jgi:hypothetical protein